MKYSNKSMIKMIEQTKKQQKKLTHITDKSALSTQDKVKIGLCRHFVQFAISRRLKLGQVAKMINLPVSRLSEITNYKIQKFTIDQLLKNLTALAEHDAQLKEFLIFFGQAADVPVLAIAKTRRLTKDLKEASLPA